MEDLVHCKTWLRFCLIISINLRNIEDDVTVDDGNSTVDNHNGSESIVVQENTNGASDLGQVSSYFLRLWLF